MSEDGPTLLFDMAAVVQENESLRPIALYIERGVHQGQSFSIPQGTLVLGRGSAANIRLEHESISRRHATITRIGNQFVIRDLGSQNGTFVNRTRISGDVELQVGDKLAIGQSLLLLQDTSKPLRSAAPKSLRPPPPTEADVEDEPWRAPRKIPLAIGGGLALLLALGLVWFWKGREPNSLATTPTAARAAPQKLQAKVRGNDDVETAESARATPSPAPAVAKPEENEPPKPRPKVERSRASERNAPATAKRMRHISSAAALARYKMGDVAGALQIAQDDLDDGLQIKLARFDSALTTAREKLGSGERSAAISHFVSAYRLDQEISKGLGVYAGQLRKQLGALYVLEAKDQLDADDLPRAKQSFTLALGYDPNNQYAKTGLRKLEVTVARPAPADNTTRPATTPASDVKAPKKPNRERAADIDAAFGG